MGTLIIDKAIEFAVNAHKNVLRKGKNVPYVLHCFETAAIVATLTEDAEIIAASILHDVLEDTNFSYQDIEKEFGKRIADFVLAETDDRSLPKTWKEIKEQSILRLKNGAKEVKMIALGDKLSNIRSIYQDYVKIGDKVWNIFHERDPKLHAWRFNELLKCFDELKDTCAYKEFEYLVNKVFNEGK